MRKSAPCWRSRRRRPSSDYARMAELKSRELQLNTELNALLEKGDPQLSMENLAHVIELWTKIPAAKIREQEFQRLSQLEKRLKSHIIGQDEAVAAVAAAVRRNRVGISPQAQACQLHLRGSHRRGQDGAGQAAGSGPLQHAGRPDPSGYVRVHGEALRLPAGGLSPGLCGL